ncbi:phosphoribosylamine--glycine ligase [Phenylobacterium kunshanense]|uniref:Phosphoribosylamine--glycine ligase n=1 Tax=Phenylobacterium kunshanense TaxID=1445034 RepID=A0A328BAK7_9CAUL|nr:phosphoribosylamine--glycine ligase [Phenylobacterium kunshanense]RAK64352.1 phosphoribosylamine--glycine ligase [Phenylobacterium kunshanense]
MNILLVGSGGREHALAWKIAASPLVKRLVAAPGNPGMAAQCEVRSVAATDVPALVALATEIAADLVVIGPESAVAVGLGDALQTAGIPCFGPVAQAGQLESSKAFTKAFTDRYGLPTSAYAVCESADDAKRALDRFEPPYVIKADGLAAGKGVVIAPERGEAEAAIDDAFGGRFGAAGARVVVEEFLEGEIGSLFALCDGKNSMLFGWAQDHKRAFDGDQGPNTGGMGTYSPAPVFTPELVEQVRTRLVEPAFAGIAADGAPYRGVLFVELMATKTGPKLVEFNVRFGDPECQVLMLRLESDLVPYLVACAEGRLAEMPPPVWRDEAAICVVLAAKGYPDQPAAGGEIRGADADFGPDVAVFHAGTRLDEVGVLRAAGGRVLNVCARAATLREARDKAYAAIAQIDFPDGFCRTDIGWRALG